MSLRSSALAATPPLGWNSWNGFGTAISAQVVRETADAMVDRGLRDVGYRYVVVDDGWSTKTGRNRDADLVPDPERFPRGIADLARYVHDRGLLFGLYSDAAELTCGGHPGSLGFEERDARLWAEWGV